MPQSSEEVPSSSIWQNFHFSGKLIVCSVIFGLMLLLVGGIVLAIGMNREEDTREDNVEDVQKKPPLTIVGPVLMGIGCFATIVGIIMCLVETKVCLKRSADKNPLIENGIEHKTRASDRETTHAVEISSKTRRHKHGHGHKRTYAGKNKTSEHHPKYEQQTSQNSLSSTSNSVNESNASKLLSSDTFLTPLTSFAEVKIQEFQRNFDEPSQNAFQSSGTSWNQSIEFQTPASSIGDTSLGSISSTKTQTLELNTPVINTLEVSQHQYLTPISSVTDSVFTPKFVNEIHKNLPTENEKSIHGKKRKINSVENNFLPIQTLESMINLPTDISETTSIYPGTTHTDVSALDTNLGVKTVLEDPNISCSRINDQIDNEVLVIQDRKQSNTEKDPIKDISNTNDCLLVRNQTDKHCLEDMCILPLDNDNSNKDKKATDANNPDDRWVINDKEITEKIFPVTGNEDTVRLGHKEDGSSKVLSRNVLTDSQSKNEEQHVELEIEKSTENTRSDISCDVREDKCQSENLWNNMHMDSNELIVPQDSGRKSEAEEHHAEAQFAEFKTNVIREKSDNEREDDEIKTGNLCISVDRENTQQIVNDDRDRKSEDEERFAEIKKSPTASPETSDAERKDCENQSENLCNSVKVENSEHIASQGSNREHKIEEHDSVLEISNHHDT